MEIIILPDADEVGRVAAAAIAHRVRRTPEAVLGLATGSSPLGIYRQLADWVEQGSLDLRHTRAFALDESKIRDVSLFSGGVIKGQKLQDYVNELVDKRPLEKMVKPFAVVSTSARTSAALYTCHRPPWFFSSSVFAGRCCACSISRSEMLIVSGVSTARGARISSMLAPVAVFRGRSSSRVG